MSDRNEERKEPDGKLAMTLGMHSFQVMVADYQNQKGKGKPQPQVS